MSALRCVASAPTALGARAIRRILVATDLTTASCAATDQALELARDLGAELLIVSVIDVASVARSAQPLPRMDQRRAARELAAQALVLRVRREGVSASFIVWEGEPGPAIVDAAASEQADVIVVGSHGRGALGRMFAGSVSEFVVRHAACPVLVVRQ